VYRIKENPALVCEAERMGKDQAAQKDINNLIEQLALGNDNPGIGNRRVKGLKNVSEARGRNEGGVYLKFYVQLISCLITKKVNREYKGLLIPI
jgi:membrane protein involved in colicin uptake